VTGEDRLAVLEARIAELEADREIRETLARYGYNADQGRSEAWVAQFADDGAMDLSLPAAWADGIDRPADASGDRIARHVGHEELLRFITDPAGHKSIEGRCLHLMVNNAVTHVDGDTAIAESYHLLLVREGSQMVIKNGTTNRWTFAKRDGRWLIEECLRRRPGAPGFDRVLITES
jgi:hypothetical protein